MRRFPIRSEMLALGLMPACRSDLMRRLSLTDPNAHRMMRRLRAASLIEVSHFEPTRTGGKQRIVYQLTQIGAALVGLWRSDTPLVAAHVWRARRGIAQSSESKP